MFSEKALKLILDAEGMDQPSEWPGGDSGISIGIGYDLGYEDNFEEDWKSYLSPEEIARLKLVLGLKGTAAKEKASQFKDIHINRSAAERVFTDTTIPREIATTRRAFPGFDELPLDAQGALVSLVYNRGSSMADSSSEDRRREMRAIRDAVFVGDLQEIADQLRSMKRLWIGKFQGLVNRRENEAALVESCIVKEGVSGLTGFNDCSSSSEGITGSSGSSSLLQTIIDAILNIFKK